MHQIRVPMNPIAYQDTLISPQFPPKKLRTLMLPLMNLQTHIHSSADDNKNILSRSNRSRSPTDYRLKKCRVGRATLLPLYNKML